ncbi:MAG TPA: hypothetical protein VGC64_09940 [Pyrinomonadaceae bacterium]|jgi:hypothetical protein
MNRNLIIGTALVVCSLFLSFGEARAQSDDERKFEIGGHFTSLTLDFGQTEPGLGVRLTYNLNKHVAFEAEGDLFPHDARNRSFRNGGRATEGLFGLKIGKRYQHFGIFAKARPGLISFTRGRFDYVPNNDGSAFPFDFRTERLTHLAFDMGGVIEFYPTRRIVTRFDAGDTIIGYSDTTVNTINGPAGGPFVLTPFHVPGQVQHNFQFTAGVGLRF